MSRSPQRLKRLDTNDPNGSTVAPVCANNGHESISLLTKIANRNNYLQVKKIKKTLKLLRQ